MCIFKSVPSFDDDEDDEDALLQDDNASMHKTPGLTESFDAGAVTFIITGLQSK